MSNVKKGDIAIIVRVESAQELPDLGKLVSVVDYGESYEDVGDSRLYWGCVSLSGPVMALDVETNEWSLSEPGEEVQMVDSFLRPIRDSDGADEVLLIAQRKDDRKVPA
jgi:hypothetical protein